MTDTEKNDAVSGSAIDPIVRRLMEIENRSKAARPGPWKAAKAGTRVLIYHDKPWYSEAEDDCIIDNNDEEVIGSSEWMRVDWVDLEFMANARADIDFLLAEIKRLRGT